MTANSTRYPEFIPNQVLTNTQLNQLREYLDGQDRLGRVRLVGMGLVCGLDWERRTLPDHHIRVREGYGIGSDGYLIGLDETDFTHVRSYQDPDVDDDGSPQYERWQTSAVPPAQLDILELLDTEEAQQAIAAAAQSEEASTNLPVALAADTGAGRVLVLYLEKKGVRLDSCLVTDCDSMGLNIELKPRVLLVREQDLQALDPCAEAQEMLRIPRLHTEVALRDVSTPDEINDAYRDIIMAALPTLVQRIGDAHRDYGRFLDLDRNADFIGRVDAMEQTLSAAAGSNSVSQSHYDALKDIAAAYNEAYAEACELLTDCCPSADFPRHLMLGALDGTSGYRQEFLPSPVRNVSDGALLRVRRLFLRIATLCERMDFSSPIQALTLAPSRTEAHPLGTRAVPWYYRDNAELAALWQPRTCCTTAPLWRADGTADFDRDYQSATLLLVSGHLGQRCASAADDFTAAARNNNLAAQVLCSCLAVDDSDEEIIRELELLAQERTRLTMILREALEQGDSGAAEASASDLGKLDNDERERCKALLDIRRAERLYCDTKDLRADYLVERASIQCRLNNLRGFLRRVHKALANTKRIDIPNELARAARIALTDRLAQVQVVHGIDAPKPDDFANRAIELLSEPDAGRLALAALQAAVEAALLRLRALLDEQLPADIRELNHGVFLALFKGVVIDLIYYLLLCTAYGVPVSGPASESPQDEPDLLDAPGGYEEEAIRARLLDMMAACDHRRVSTLYQILAWRRGNDLSRFANLARAFPGLEHLGGVEKGGLLVLVCDRGGDIVADFALPVPPPCCCDVEPDDICLAPVAMPDFRILEVAVDGEEGQLDGPLDLLLRVRANDYDPMNKGDPEKPRDPADEDDLDVSVDEPVSLLGAKLGVQSKEGVIEYQQGNPIPGTIDRFEYRLERTEGDCKGGDRASVLVMLLPKVAGGTIEGTVFNDLSESVEPQAGVRILESGASTLSDSKGEYSFSGLPAGTYTLSASAGDLVSQPVQAVLSAGGRVSLDLHLGPSQPSAGGIVGTVRSSSQGGVMPGSTVTILENGRTAGSGSDGSYRFDGVNPGSYSLRASLGDLLSAVVGVEVQAGTFTPQDLFLNDGEPQPGSILGNVVLPNGRPAVEAIVGIESLGIEAGADKNGDFRIDELPAGTYVLIAKRGDLVSPEISVTVPPGGEASVTLVLRGG